MNLLWRLKLVLGWAAAGSGLRSAVSAGSGRGCGVGLNAHLSLRAQ